MLKCLTLMYSIWRFPWHVAAVKTVVNALLCYEWYLNMRVFKTLHTRSIIRSSTVCTQFNSVLFSTH